MKQSMYTRTTTINAIIHSNTIITVDEYRVYKLIGFKHHNEASNFCLKLLPHDAESNITDKRHLVRFVPCTTCSTRYGTWSLNEYFYEIATERFYTVERDIVTNATNLDYDKNKTVYIMWLNITDRYDFMLYVGTKLSYAITDVRKPRGDDTYEELTNKVMDTITNSIKSLADEDYDYTLSIVD